MYEDANRAIWNAYHQSQARRASQGHYPALIQAIDQLLFELEELNLDGVDRVPGTLRERSSRVLAFVPAEDPEEIRIRYRIIPMMDTLFRAQELVFRAKDPARPSEHGDEERSA